MDNTIWQLWPWITLFVFVLLIKVFGGRSQSERVMYVPADRETGDGCGAVGTVLIISLIVGAAVCILLLNA